MKIGFGGGHIDGLDERDAEALLRGVVELGVELVDTARSYGRSEERIGKYLANAPVRISTKVGYGIHGHEDWTPSCIRAGIEAARKRLQRDTIDIVHLHSCPVETLAAEGVIDALVEARDAGHIKQAGYSGDNAELTWALAASHFDVVQTTINVCDTSGLDRIENTKAVVLAKRPLANAPWRFTSRPDAFDLGIYYDRWQAMRQFPGIVLGDPVELSIRFVAHAQNVSTVLVGTTKLAHLERAIEAAREGPLASETEAIIRRASRNHSQIT